MARLICHFAVWFSEPCFGHRPKIVGPSILITGAPVTRATIEIGRSRRGDIGHAQIYSRYTNKVDRIRSDTGHYGKQDQRGQQLPTDIVHQHPDQDHGQVDHQKDDDRVV